MRESRRPITLPATFLLPDINPEPWTTPVVGKSYAVKRPKLRVYQNAIVSEWTKRYGHLAPVAKGTPLRVRFVFSRSSAGGKHADATNLQKAVEDALQGLLYYNDTHTREVSSLILYQGTDVDHDYGVLIQAEEFIAPTEADNRRWADMWDKHRRSVVRTPKSDDAVWREQNLPDF